MMNVERCCAERGSLKKKKKQQQQGVWFNAEQLKGVEVSGFLGLTGWPGRWWLSWHEEGSPRETGLGSPMRCHA